MNRHRFDAVETSNVRIEIAGDQRRSPGAGLRNPVLRLTERLLQCRHRGGAASSGGILRTTSLNGSTRTGPSKPIFSGAEEAPSHR